MLNGAPAPTPSTILPPDSTSSDVTALIRTPGWRYETDVTMVPSRMRRVWPAMKASVAYASSIGASGGWPLRRIWKKWSIVQMVSTRASSAVRAMRATVGPISVAGPGHEKFVTPMPIFTALALVS